MDADGRKRPHLRWESKGALGALTVVLATLFSATLLLASWNQSQNARTQALANAKRYTDVVAEFRTLYTSEVVSTVLEEGVVVTHDYKSRPGSVPLPATLSMELGKKITESGNAKVSLYSPYPFPWRQDGGLKDNFAKTAWRQLSSNPQKPFYQFVESNGETTLRYATADTLRPQCVKCHNTHPQTPRNGWQVGDLRGIVETSIPLGKSAGLSPLSGSLSWVILPGFLAAAIFLLLFFWRLQALTMTLENRVEERTMELSDQVHQYRMLFDTTPAGIVVYGRNNFLKYWNPAFGRMFGYTLEDLNSMTLDDLTHPQDRGDEPNLEAQIEKRLLRHSGEIIWARLNTRAMKIDSNGQTLEFFVMLEDMTHQHKAADLLLNHRDHLQKEVDRRTKSLEASNRELEAFCYSVSHDLRAPLRSITGYSNALLEEHADAFEEEGLHYLQRVLVGVDRMSTLINGMLRLSQLIRQKMRTEAVDMTSLANSLISELREADPQRVVHFDVEEGLVIRGDAQLLRIALCNLLDNAWKFTKKTKEAKIEFRLLNNGDERHFYIRDNGAGFDTAHKGKLFSPFRRLHNEKDFPGTGIGLATVRRIIHRHGGRVWADGRSGEGSTFWFEIPDRVKEKKADS